MNFKLVAIQLSHCNQSDSVSKLVREMQIRRMHTVDSNARNLRPMQSRAKGEMSKDGQLLCRVAAVDVHRRIGFGVALSLGFRQRRRELHPLLFHLINDEITRPVQDASQ